MKNFVFLLIGLFQISSSIAQWRIQNPLPQSKSLSSVYFTDANTGYAVGDSGIILKTIDSGSKWSALSSGTLNNLYSVFFPDMDTGYVVGDVGTILKTTNGGSIWDFLSDGTNDRFRSSCFLDGSVGYIAGGGWDMSKTSNGGKSWTNLRPTDYSNGNLTSVYFTDSNTGYRTSFYVNWGAIEKTTDGGITWPLSKIFDDGDLFSVFFTDPDTGYAVGGDFWTERNSIIIKTTNAGADWSIKIFTDSHILRSVYFTDANTGYAVGDSGTILKTFNGGEDWTIQNSGTLHNLKSVFFNDANNGCIVGDSGIILKTTNGGESATSGVKIQTMSSDFLKIYPNPTRDILTIEISVNLNKSELSILTTNGQQLLTYPITKLKTQLDISNLPGGIYFVRLSGDQLIRMEKFVKQ